MRRERAVVAKRARRLDQVKSSIPAQRRPIQAKSPPERSPAGPSLTYRAVFG